MIDVRGSPLKVSMEPSPRKITLSNMFKAKPFLEKSGVNPETYLLCPKSCKILSKSTYKNLEETSKGSNGCGIV